jgi:ABC-type glucose/galactose transport system permease subunit
MVVLIKIFHIGKLFGPLNSLIRTRLNIGLIQYIVTVLVGTNFLFFKVNDLFFERITYVELR